MTSAAEAGAEQPAAGNRWTVAIFALIGLGLGLLIYSMRTPSYEAESLVTINNPIGTLADEVAVASSPTVLGAAEAILGYPPEVTITAADVASLLTVTATASDPQDAKNTADVVASTYVSAQTNAAATVAQTAEIPTGRSGLPALAYAAIGTILGAAVGAVVSLLQSRRPDTTSSREQAPERPDLEVPPTVDLREPTTPAAPTEPFDPFANPVTSSFDSEPPRAQPWQPDRVASGGIWSEPASTPPSPSRVDAFESAPVTQQPAASATPPRPPQPTPPRPTPPSPAAPSSPTPPRPTPPSPAAPPRPTPPSPATPPRPTPPSPAAPPGPTPPSPAAPPSPVAPSRRTPPTYTPENTQPTNDTPPPEGTQPPKDTRPTGPSPSPTKETTTPRATMSPSVTQSSSTEATAAGSFSQASTANAASEESANVDVADGDFFGDDLGPASFAELSELDRRAMRSQYDTLKYELELKHQEELAQADVERERQTAELRSEITDLNKQLRVQGARLQSRTGRNQNRVGDLEAQVDALEIELAGLRQQLETERIAHTKRLTEERGTADRALDNARREYRDELAKHLHTHRATLATHRAELDQTLADDRAKHAADLKSAHDDYEKTHEIERKRAEAQHVSNNQRHQRELAALTESTKQELDRQIAQHKETIASLRDRSDNNDDQLRELEKENRLIRAELSTQQKQARHNDGEHQTAVQRLNDEISVMRGELEGERERNAALRADVLRRSAEAHQVIDRAVAERTAQLTELESSVARQREYADARVREISASAEEQARQATMREANLTASISRLKREVEELNAKLRSS